MPARPILDLLNHDAMPPWRSWRFWLDFRLLSSPAYWVVGFVLALYTLAGLGAGALVFAASGGALLAPATELAIYIACIYIGENVARAVLDITIGRPFAAENAPRFRRAGAGATALAVGLILARYAEISTAQTPVGASPGVDIFVAFMAVVLFSLAGAFRRGAAIQQEQNLTV